MRKAAAAQFGVPRTVRLLLSNAGWLNLRPGFSAQHWRDGPHLVSAMTMPSDGYLRGGLCLRFLRLGFYAGD